MYRTVALIYLSYICSHASTEPIPKSLPVPAFPLRDGMKHVYNFKVTGLAGVKDTEIEYSTLCNKTKEDDKGKYFDVEINLSKNADSKIVRKYFVSNDNKTFVFENNDRFEYPHISKLKVESKIMMPIFSSKGTIKLEATIHAHEDLECNKISYRTTKYSVSNEPEIGNVYKSTIWMTDGTGPGIVKQISEQMGVTIETKLKDYTPGK